MRPPCATERSAQACVGKVLHTAMASNVAITIDNRLVVDYEMRPRSRGKFDQRVIPSENVEVIDGIQVVSLSTADRGMAKAVGADMGQSVPLGAYTWIDTARQLRGVTVNALLDQIAKREGHYICGG